MGGGAEWRDEYTVRLLKTSAESGPYVLKTTIFLTSLQEMKTNSMISHLFHIFH